MKNAASVSKKAEEFMLQLKKQGNFFTIADQLSFTNIYPYTQIPLPFRSVAADKIEKDEKAVLEKEKLILQLKGQGSAFTTADQWFSLGKAYDTTSNYHTHNEYLAAIFCYERALQLNENHVQALSRLSSIYSEDGAEVKKDKKKAQDYREKLEKAKAQQWYEQGNNFFHGINGCGPDYKKAHTCYLNALTCNPNHAASLFSMGLLYHNGHEVKQDYIEALDWYAKAKQQGFKKAKKNLKDLVRTLALDYYTQDKDINKKGRDGSTLLHWTTQNRLLKHTARLMRLKANKEIPNDKNKLPFANLNEGTYFPVVNCLQSQLSDLIAILEASPSEVLVERTHLERAKLNKRQARVQLDNLYQNPLLRPLLDLAKLCAYGLHNLSEREKFKKKPGTPPVEDYDSDDDADEKFDRCQFLSIRIDPDSHSVCNIAHYGDQGLGGKDAYGVYLHTKTDTPRNHANNTVYVGGKRDLPGEFLSTLIHELTHLLTKEVFQNNCKPYAIDDTENQEFFTKMATALEQKKSSLDSILDSILQLAFLEGYKKNDQVHDELIVRTSEIIVRYSDGLERLQQQA